MAAVIGLQLGHYWTRDDSPAMRDALTHDWITDLVEFGPYVVEAAFAEWRRKHDKRPAIANIRALCREQQERAELARSRALPKPPKPYVSPEEARAAAERYLRSRGMGMKTLEDYYDRYTTPLVVTVAEGVEVRFVPPRRPLPCSQPLPPEPKSVRAAIADVHKALGVTATEQEPAS